MEKLNFKKLSSSTSLFFHNMAMGNISPDFVWRVMLCVAMVTLLSIGVMSYVAYDWAISNDTTLAPTHASGDSFSPKELRDVLDIYKKKEAAFNALLHTPPVAPALGKGTGVKTDPSISDTVPDLTLPPTAPLQ